MMLISRQPNRRPRHDRSTSVAHCRRTLLATLGAAALALALPGASPASITFGDGLGVPEPDIATYACQKACTLAITTAPANLAQFMSPISGTITRWRIETNATSTPQMIRLRVLAPALNGKFTGAGSSAPVRVPLVAGTFTFRTHLGIAAGDFIGLDTQGGALGAVAVEAESISVFGPPLANFGTPRIGMPEDYALLVNADVVKTQAPSKHRRRQIRRRRHTRTHR